MIVSSRDRDDEWKAPVQVVAGLHLLYGDSMLVQLRPPGLSLPGMWELPGGKVEPGENPRAALAREWREELGVVISVGDALSTARLHVQVTYAITLYAVTIAGDQIPQPLHATDLRWEHPLVAIRSLPCVPSTYLFYRHIRDYIDARRPA